MLARSVISTLIDRLAIASTELESGWTQMEPDFEKLWANPTLGAAANGVFLDVLEAQQAENRAAEIEGRPARNVKRDQRFPGWEQHKVISSDYSDVSFGDQFDDGSPVTYSQGAPRAEIVLPKTVRKK